MRFVTLPRISWLASCSASGVRFQASDIIEVAGHRGLVDSMNTRSTTIMTVEGNHVQIPNATIFKSTIVNLTSNPKLRGSFTIGIGYEFSIADAQRIATETVSAQPEVLSDPPPQVLVDNLSSSSVNLCVYFWLDYTQHSPIKLRSILIRKTFAHARGQRNHSA